MLPQVLLVLAMPVAMALPLIMRVAIPLEAGR